MPLKIHRYLDPEGEIGLWNITEAAEFFEDKLELAAEELEQLDRLKGHRRIEWLAARWLLHKMSGRQFRGACLKDEHGKPYLQGSLFSISISHSRELAAVIAAPRAVGIDIQKIVEKIDRIAHKFMREEETESLEPDTELTHLHVYWGAKEALYKAYGRRQLDFREHIHIKPFQLKGTKGQFKGEVIKDEFHATYLLEYEIIDEFVLVYAMEDIGDQRYV